MIKSILFFLTCLLFTSVLIAQNLKVSAGTDITVRSGTIFSVDSLTLTPSADFTLSNVSLNKLTTATHTPVNTYIARVYNFSSTSNPFSGSVQVNYRDGAELNGIAENALTLNVYNGTGWAPYAAASRDAVQNFVLTAGLSNISFAELTLADVLHPLPLNWLFFTAVKKDGTALLNWGTAQEQNTRDFTVQHSIDAVTWTVIGTVPALGGSTGTTTYSFVHATPRVGINYYRILQTDRNSRFSYSDTRALNFAANTAFTVLRNPSAGGILSLQVNIAGVFSLYSADGRLVWVEKLSTGIINIGVHRFAKGVYLIKAANTIEKIIIQ
jgi:hypothetical protein